LLRMIIKNVKPKKAGVVRTIEEVELKDDVKYKETSEGEIKE